MAEFRTSVDFDSAWLAPSGILDDRYEIRRVLGHGGAAVVLLAVDRRYDRQVAIKVLKPELAGVVASERFLQEVRITASLQHPHILPLLDSGESRGLPYYITPYVSGGSLRDRLQEARQLPLDEALGITADVAAALQCAHEHQILHRDIKPENILLANGHAIVADFGLAQALVRAGGDRLTSSGIVVGTPAYISPEQASGERALGPTTDVYSLACVVYEMIAGVPPFVGPTAESVIAQRFRGPAHPLRHYRPTVSDGVNGAVARAMCSAPADRFQSAREFATALGVARGSGDHPSTSREAARSSRSVLALRAGAAVVILALALSGTALVRRAIGARSLDSTRYVVFPATGEGGKGLTPGIATRQLASALRRWQGIRVVELTPGDSSPRAVNDVASGRGAANYLTTTVRSLGDSTEISAALWRTSADSAPIGERTLRVRSENALTDDRWRRLTASLLAGSSAIDADDARGTTSLDAWRAYARGQEARNRWDLARADSSFRAAVTADSRFGKAQLWLAQVGAWARPDQPQSWREAAARAVDLSSNLTKPDSILSVGLAALGAGDFPTSCAAFRSLHDLEPTDVVPWLGLGQCLATDGTVVRDAKSPSGWSFRTSWRAAAAAYDSALRRTDGAPAFAFQWLSRILLVDRSWSRLGFGPDSAIFRSYPGLQHDTLAYVPYPAAEFEAGSPRVDRTTIAAALQQNAKHIESAYTEWTQRAPTTPDAWEALALIQEVTGETAAQEGGGLLALESNERARHLTSNAEQQLRLVHSAVRLLAKSEQFAAANRLADSVLRAVPRADGSQAAWLAGIAALVGRVERTAELLRVKARANPVDVFGISPPPSPVADAAITYETLAAAGVCGDALRQALSDLNQALERYVPAPARDSMSKRVIARAASLSVPCVGARAVDSITSPDPLVAMQKAVAAHDVSGFHRQLSAVDRARRFSRPGDISPDHLFQEAWLLAATGDTAAAATRLDMNLTALTTLNSHLLDDIPSAAALGREMVLRADLAAADKDTRVARRWANNVLALWAGASQPLDGELSRMRELASTHTTQRSR